MNKMSLLQDLFKGDRVIWIVFALLCLISVVEVFSAASALSYESGNFYEPITQHTINLGLGFLVILIFHRLHYRWFRILPVFLLPMSIAMLLAVSLMGMLAETRVNGAARWLFGFQPSEFAKIGLMMTVAHILARCQTKDGCSPKAFKPILICSGIILGLIAPENASTALLLGTVVFLMMVVACVPKRQLLMLTGSITLVVTIFVTFIMTVPPSVYKEVPGTHRFVTWRNRINDFFNEEEVPAAKFDIEGKAQEAHSHIAVATSHIWGKGPGNSTQRDHLAHGYSDFIFAISIEELGLIGGGFIVLLYVILLFRTGRIASRCEKTYPALIAIGSCLMIVLQASLHMMVSVGMFPITGQPLPLVSKGGTSIIINCIYIAIMLSVSQFGVHSEDDEDPSSNDELCLESKETIQEHKTETITQDK